MEKIQTVALVAFEGLPFASPKIELAARFGHLLSRHVGLCQLVRRIFQLQPVGVLLIFSLLTGAGFGRYSIES